MGELHDRHHAEIHKLLLDAGEKPDENGSFMQTVHASIISLRASITGLKSALSSFASGEGRIVAMYNEVLTDLQNPAVAAILIRQKFELQSRITDLKANESETSGKF
ncbi:MAG: PA2169 family four-helix-bundle protein [Beijerinckiaceae bacterium]|nr:PA2169 family four-helix-bundle protein [Beijerinckiaceae bacterium]